MQHTKNHKKSRKNLNFFPQRLYFCLHMKLSLIFIWNSDEKIMDNHRFGTFKVLFNPKKFQTLFWGNIVI